MSDEKQAAPVYPTTAQAPAPAPPPAPAPVYPTPVPAQVPPVYPTPVPAPSAPAYPVYPTPVPAKVETPYTYPTTPAPPPPAPIPVPVPVSPVSGKQYQDQLFAPCAAGHHEPTTKFGTCGIITAICCFPIGLLCLCADKEVRCARCGVLLL